MKTFFRAALCVLLALVILLTIAGCKDERNTIVLDEDHTEREPGKEAEEALTPEELTNHWEGVFQNAEGYVIIREAEEDVFKFTISLESGSLTGFALINGETAEYMEESFGLAMSVSGDKLMLQQEGENSYGDFSGIFNRTAEDPYTFVIIKETDELPGDEEQKEPDEGEDYNENFAAIQTPATYADPDGRFTVTYPDVFVMGDAELQPADGVHMESIDALAYMNIEVVEKYTETAEALVQHLDENYGILATVRPDGLVVYSNRYTDGYNEVWAEFVFMRIMEHGMVQVEYTFAEELYDQCEIGSDLITIQ